MNNELMSVEGRDYSPFLIPLARKLKKHGLFCDPNNIRYALGEQNADNPETSESLQESIQTILRDPNAKLLIVVLTGSENPDEKVTDEEVELLAAYLQGQLLNANAKYYRQPISEGSVIRDTKDGVLDHRDAYSTKNPEKAKIFGMPATEDPDRLNIDYSKIPESVVPTHSLLVRRIIQYPTNDDMERQEIIMQVERLSEVYSVDD